MKYKYTLPAWFYQQKKTIIFLIIAPNGVSKSSITNDKHTENQIYTLNNRQGLQYTAKMHSYKLLSEKKSVVKLTENQKTLACI